MIRFKTLGCKQLVPRFKSTVTAQMSMWHYLPKKVFLHQFLSRNSERPMNIQYMCLWIFRNKWFNFKLLYFQCMCQKEKNTSVPSKSAAAFLRLSPFSLPGRDCKHERKTQNNIVQSPQVTSYSLITIQKYMVQYHFHYRLKWIHRY